MLSVSRPWRCPIHKNAFLRTGSFTAAAAATAEGNHGTEEKVSQPESPRRRARSPHRETRDRANLLDPEASNEDQQGALLEAEEQFAAIQQAQATAAQQLQEALRTAGVDAPATERTQALTQALQEGDFAKAEAEARRLNADEALAPEEAQNLSAALRQMAEATEDVDATFSESLNTAAQHLETGETSAGLEALAESSQQQEAAAAAQEELGSLQAGLQSGRERN
jgi:hypothetical protein